MKYSTVFVAAFATGALARALPGDNPVTLEQQGATADKSVVPTVPDTTYPDTTDKSKYPTDKYPTDTDKSKYPTDKYPTDTDKSKYPTDDKSKYPTTDDKDYQKQVTDYNQKYYAPVDKSTYDDKKAKPDYKPYSPQPPNYDEGKSCYDKFKWPTNVHKEKPCAIEWQPKHGGDYKPEDDCKIYLYHTKDYTKPHSTVCEECGKGSYDKWTPPTDCESSDDSGYMYRFKFVKKDDESSCTWGEEFPIYGDKYDDKKESVCPPPAPVPDCPPAPPMPPAKAPETPSYPAPATPATAPETPSYPATAPEAPAPAAAAASSYPTAEAPTQGVANLTAPEVGAGSAIRSSVSVIFTVAALVTFLL